MSLVSMSEGWRVLSVFNDFWSYILVGILKGLSSIHMQIPCASTFFTGLLIPPCCFSRTEKWVWCWFCRVNRCMFATGATVCTTCKCLVVQNWNGLQNAGVDRGPLWSVSLLVIKQCLMKHSIMCMLCWRTGTLQLKADRQESSRVVFCSFLSIWGSFVCVCVGCNLFWIDLGLGIWAETSAPRAAPSCKY